MKYINLLLCYLGWHSWKYDMENIQPYLSGKPCVTIAWKQCEECGDSKLTMILR